MFTCKVDHKEFDNEKDFLHHIRWDLKIKLEDYYTKYEQRRDLQTRELIKYKSKEFYFSSLFNSRESMIQYFKNHDDLKTAIKVIELRNSVKQFSFAPSTVECRTSIMVTPTLIERLGGYYNSVCQSLNIKTRYDYSQCLSFDKSGALITLVDTREQKPLTIPGEMIVSKLDFGDYTSKSHYKRVFIERKSLVDLCGTLSKGFDRLQRELERAAAMGGYIIICVESNLDSLNHLSQFPETSMVKASSDFLGARLREICQSFDNVQFLFLDGRVKMSQIIEKIFRMKNDVRTVDLQYFCDKKLL